MQGRQNDETIERDFRQLVSEVAVKCEKILASHSHKFLCSKKISTGDFAVFGILENWFLNPAFGLKELFDPICS